MERGGPFTGGENPEDPDGAGDDTDAPQRGWVSPEDRLWRHPSEVSGLGLPRPASSYLPSGSLPRRRALLTSLAVGVVGAAAIATTLAVVLTLVDSKGASTPLEARREQPRPTSRRHRRRHSRPRPSSERRDAPRHLVRPSLVGLEPVDASGPAQMTGVVLPGGALVVTAASAVAGVSQLDVLTSTGKRMRGQVRRDRTRHSGRGGHQHRRRPRAGHLRRRGRRAQRSRHRGVPVCRPRRPRHFRAHRRRPRWGWSKKSVPASQLDGGPTSSTPSRRRCHSARRRGAACSSTVTDACSGILDGQMSLGQRHRSGCSSPPRSPRAWRWSSPRPTSVDHGWLGVAVHRPVTRIRACAEGAEVTSILPGSPALKAGLKPGDVVVGVDTHRRGLGRRSPGTPLHRGARARRCSSTCSMGRGESVVTVKLADPPTADAPGRSARYRSRRASPGGGPSER